ncbi:hypothetical protein QF047_000783 [Arthrobacter sp. W4I7]|nr:hypothetical protein [Arthrobacter sp. W4I7]
MATMLNNHRDAAATRLYSSGPDPRMRLWRLFQAPSINHQAAARTTENHTYGASSPTELNPGPKPKRIRNAPMTAQVTTKASTICKRREERLRQLASSLIEFPHFAITL